MGIQRQWYWIPAFAGMTDFVKLFVRHYTTIDFVDDNSSSLTYELLSKYTEKDNLNVL